MNQESLSRPQEDCHVRVHLETRGKNATQTVSEEDTTFRINPSLPTDES